MPALERLRGIRVVADPASLDRATWDGDEVGFVGAWLDLGVIEPHTEWPLPAEQPALAQGSIAGVPAKLWLPDDGDALLVTAASYADELTSRLR